MMMTETTTTKTTTTTAGKACVGGDSSSNGHGDHPSHQPQQPQEQQDGSSSSGGGGAPWRVRRRSSGGGGGTTAELSTPKTTTTSGSTRGYAQVPNKKKIRGGAGVGGSGSNSNNGTYLDDYSDDRDYRRERSYHRHHQQNHRRYDGGGGPDGRWGRRYDGQHHRNPDHRNGGRYNNHHHRQHHHHNHHHQQQHQYNQQRHRNHSVDHWHRPPNEQQNYRQPQDPLDVSSHEDNVEYRRHEESSSAESIPKEVENSAAADSSSSSKDTAVPKLQDVTATAMTDVNDLAGDAQQTSRHSRNSSSVDTSDLEEGEEEEGEDEGEDKEEKKVETVDSHVVKPSATDAEKHPTRQCATTIPGDESEPLKQKSDRQFTSGENTIIANRVSETEGEDEEEGEITDEPPTAPPIGKKPSAPESCSNESKGSQYGFEEQPRISDTAQTTETTTIPADESEPLKQKADRQQLAHTGRTRRRTDSELEDGEEEEDGEVVVEAVAPPAPLSDFQQRTALATQENQHPKAIELYAAGASRAATDASEPLKQKADRRLPKPNAEHSAAPSVGSIRQPSIQTQYNEAYPGGLRRHLLKQSSSSSSMSLASTDSERDEEERQGSDNAQAHVTSQKLRQPEHVSRSNDSMDTATQNSGGNRTKQKVDRGIKQEPAKAMRRLDGSNEQENQRPREGVPSDVRTEKDSGTGDMSRKRKRVPDVHVDVHVDKPSNATGVSIPPPKNSGQSSCPPKADQERVGDAVFPRKKKKGRWGAVKSSSASAVPRTNGSVALTATATAASPTGALSTGSCLRDVGTSDAEAGLLLTKQNPSDVKIAPPNGSDEKKGASGPQVAHASSNRCSEKDPSSGNHIPRKNGKKAVESGDDAHASSGKKGQPSKPDSSTSKTAQIAKSWLRPNRKESPKNPLVAGESAEGPALNEDKPQRSKVDCAARPSEPSATVAKKSSTKIPRKGDQHRSSQLKVDQMADKSEMAHFPATNNDRPSEPPASVPKKSSAKVTRKGDQYLSSQSKADQIGDRSEMARVPATNSGSSNSQSSSTSSLTSCSAHKPAPALVSNDSDTTPEFFAEAASTVSEITPCNVSNHHYPTAARPVAGTATDKATLHCLQQQRFDQPMVIPKILCVHQKKPTSQQQQTSQCKKAPPFPKNIHVGKPKPSSTTAQQSTSKRPGPATSSSSSKKKKQQQQSVHPSSKKPQKQASRAKSKDPRSEGKAKDTKSEGKAKDKSEGTGKDRKTFPKTKEGKSDTKVKDGKNETKAKGGKGDKAGRSVNDAKGEKIKAERKGKDGEQRTGDVGTSENISSCKDTERKSKDKKQDVPSKAVQKGKSNTPPQPAKKVSKDCKDISLVNAGSRVAIFWDADGQYFKGLVTKEKIQLGRRVFFVKYDDGDKEWIDLSQTRFRLIRTKSKEDNGPAAPGDGKEPTKERQQSESKRYPTSSTPSDAGTGWSKHVFDQNVVGGNDWVAAGTQPDDSSDSDTDEEEVMEWAQKMFGIARPLARKRDSLDTSSHTQNDCDASHAVVSVGETSDSIVGEKRKFTDEEWVSGAGMKRPRVDHSNSPGPESDAIRKKEEARTLTAEEVQMIIGEETTEGTENWVRRSVRQPSQSALASPLLKSLIEKLPANDPDMVVLKMKKYLNDPNAPVIVINAALDALEQNTNCQALYIQNFNEGMRDEQVLHLLKILQQPSCNIWCLNIGETYKVKRKTWKKFAKGLRHTKVTHMYASEHTISAELKEKIRLTIRNNRMKHDMHIDPENLDTIVRCTHCWWNPINAKALQPFIRKRGYEHMLHDAEAQGLRGSTSGAYLS